jgi:hypothetical protein
MIDQNHWVSFKDIEWSDSNYNKFNIDTRDFHVGYLLSEQHPDTEFLHKKYKSDFFHTEDELKALIERYYNESGGKQDWRYFSIQKSDNWHLKYIRVFRSNYGFLVCDKDNKAIRKDILSKSYLKQI